MHVEATAKPRLHWCKASLVEIWLWSSVLKQKTGHFYTPVFQPMLLTIDLPSTSQQQLSTCISFVFKMAFLLWTPPSGAVHQLKISHKNLHDLQKKQTPWRALQKPLFLYKFLLCWSARFTYIVARVIPNLIMIDVLAFLICSTGDIVRPHLVIGFKPHDNCTLNQGFRHILFVLIIQ